MWEIIFLVALAIDSAFNIVGNLKGVRKIVFVSKPLLMPCIIGFYIASTMSWNLLIVIALLFGLGGDVFLLWKKTNPKAVLLGLLSFLVGHVVYIVAFGLSMGWFSAWQWWFSILILPYLLYAAVIYRMLRQGLEKMKIPTIVYMVVLLIMSFFALARMAVFSGLAFWFVFIGSIFFVISDSVLAIEQFKKHDEILHHTIVMATYIAAQLLIAAGFIA